MLVTFSITPYCTCTLNFYADHKNDEKSFFSSAHTCWGLNVRYILKIAFLWANMMKRWKFESVGNIHVQSNYTDSTCMYFLLPTSILNVYCITYYITVNHDGDENRLETFLVLQKKGYMQTVYSLIIIDHHTIRIVYVEKKI